MVMVELKGLHAVKSKGRMYYYAWRGGPRLKSEFGTPAFFAEWESLKHPGYEADRRKFATWVELYRRSPEYKALADSTRHNWDPWLDKVSLEFGDLSLAQFDWPQIKIAIKKWRDKWREKPRTADYAKQVLSRVCAYTVAEGALKLNPCPGVANLYQCDRAEIIWTEADLEQLCKFASPEVAHAAQLAALTGLRQGDLLALSWSHVGRGDIEIRTGKSRGRRRALVPITAEIRRLLESIPKRSTRVLTNSEGQPWRGFGSSWHETMIRAGMHDRDLHFHDLRGTAATNFYRAGFTVREIAQTLGWAENKVERLIDLYVKRDEIMADRARRLEVLQQRELSSENNGR